jgi:Putative auto-transporter adhesin, head GIN domain
MTVAPASIYRYRLALGAALVLLASTAVLLLVQYGGSSSSTVQGSGIAASSARAVPGFSGVELAGSNVVTVHVGGKPSVVVHGDDNLLGRVTTQVWAGSLVIGNTPGSVTSRTLMSVEVTVPSLESLVLSGSGVLVVDGLETPTLTATLSGSGVLRASGTATKLEITLGGSGDAQLDELVARDVHAVVRGSGRILVTATASLDASVPGSGAIVYSGNPAYVTTNVAGSGAIVRG